MKLPEHLVTAPEADETDCVGVDVPQKERHRLTITKGAGGDVADGDTNPVSHGVICHVECGGNLGAPDGAPPGGCVDAT